MKSLAGQKEHGALVTGDHDDRARQDFAFTLRNLVTAQWMPATRTVFDRQAAPAFARATGEEPRDPATIRAAMDATPWYRFYLSARRTSQEMIWHSVIPAIAAHEPAPLPASPLGSLELDPALVPPRYATAIDIHCMPGGYGMDRGEGDIAAGALYDRGVYLYLSGLAGPLNDGIGQLAAAWLKRRLPDFAPADILDMGCGVGHATLAWADAFPQARVHGIDIGAALLRYAHLRAESLGKAVHFHQRNAEASGFADGSFDLVTSAILLHESSTRALPAIMAECHRLLRPGGIMLHVDQPRFERADAWATFLQENETHYNNEPFWRRFRMTDLAQAARAAGFAADSVETGTISAEVIRQAQNNRPGEADQDDKGFAVLMARKPCAGEAP